MIKISEEFALREIFHAFNGDELVGCDDDEITQQLYAQMLGWTS